MTMTHARRVCCAQAEDRCHRIGQLAERVTVTYLLGANTIDEILWPLLQRKARVLGETLEGSSDGPTGLAGGVGVAPGAVSVCRAGEAADHVVAAAMASIQGADDATRRASAPAAVAAARTLSTALVTRAASSPPPIARREAVGAAREVIHLDCSDNEEEPSVPRVPRAGGTAASAAHEVVSLDSSDGEEPIKPRGGGSPGAAAARSPGGGTLEASGSSGSNGDAPYGEGHVAARGGHGGSRYAGVASPFVTGACGDELDDELGEALLGEMETLASQECWPEPELELEAHDADGDAELEAHDADGDAELEAHDANVEGEQNHDSEHESDAMQVLPWVHKGGAMKSR